MKTYTVTYPITGTYSVTVEAENEEDAKVKGFDIPLEDGDLMWSPVNRIVQGNVFMGDLNEVEVVEE